MMAASTVVFYALLLFLLLFCGNIETVEYERKNDLVELLKRKGLNVLHQNIRGLLVNFSGLQALFSSHPNIDVFTLSETHISTAEDVDQLYDIPGYNFEKRNRNTGKGGGVAVYINDNINYVRRTDLEIGKLESIVIEIVFKNSHNVLIATHYRPPNGTKHLPSNYNELLETSLSLCCAESKDVILIGDMNVNYLNSRDNREVKAIIQQKGLTQIIKKPTRVTQDTKSLIDIIATNNPGSIAEQDVIPTSLSDHDLVGCVRKLNNKMYTSKTVKTRNYAKYNPDNMNRDFEQVNWLPVLSLSNVNDAVNTFNGIVKDIFDKHAPIIQKRVKGRPCAWLNENLKSIINQRDQLLRKARKSNSASDWRKYKDLRNKCNNMQKNAKAKHHKNLIDENRTNPKGFWKAVKTIFPTKANTKNASNNEKDNQTRANAFRDYFSTVVNNLKSSAFKLKNFI